MDHCCNDDLRPGGAVSPAERELAVRGFVALWRGEQLTISELGGDAEMTQAMVHGGRLEVDTAGRLVAVHGLAARSTAHRIEHAGGIVQTWCAFDAIGIPAALGIDARAITACSTCGRELRVTMIAGRPVEAEVLRLWLPAGDCAHLVDDFCRRANLYCDADHLTAAGLREKGEVVTVADAAAIGRVTWCDVAVAIGALAPKKETVENLDAKANTVSCYLDVGDADALHAQWAAANVAGRLDPPVDTDYGMREGCHVDPDGNILRFGSPLADTASSDNDGSVLLSGDDPIAVQATAAVQSGDLAGLDRLLTEHPQLATARIGDEGCSRTLLHAATDWPGNFPNGPAVVARLVQAGADVDAHFHGGHAETPLHWAASSNDVAVLDALLDAGADIEAPGAVLGGGSPLADACGFGNWDAARRLVERGARTRLKDAAALGLLDRVQAAFAKPAGPEPDQITQALWSACHGGQRAAAEYLLERAADINWIGWDNLTCLDAAAQSEAVELVDWLRDRGAKRADELA